MKTLFIVLLSLSLWFPLSASAATEDECAIWLCMPAGFPDGCGAAYDAFNQRLKDLKPPLPAFSECDVLGKQTGRYQQGYEQYEECSEGYVLREVEEFGSVTEGICYVQVCAPPDDGKSENLFCKNYEAKPRVKPNYIDFWFNGEYDGRYFY